jgi:hypothetical protein
MTTVVLKAIEYFDTARKFQRDCDGNLRVEGGRIWLHLTAANMGVREALR